MSYVLRPYQVDAVEAGVRFFLDKAARYNALMMLPTGSGKSLCIAGIAQRLDGPVLVFQPSKEILEQNLAKYESYGNRAAVYSASFNRKEIDHVTFATIGSVKNKADLFRAFRYIIIDECHGVCAKNEDGMYTRFLRELGDVKVLGMSVGSDSTVELVGGPFGKGFVGRIEDAFEVAISSGLKVYEVEQYDVIELNGVAARGWNGCGFAWKDCRKIIRHSASGIPMMEIVAHSNRIRLTDNHSIYVAVGGENVRVLRGRSPATRKRPSIKCISASGIKAGDILMGDDGAGWESEKEHTYDMVEFVGSMMKESRARIKCDTKSIPMNVMLHLAAGNHPREMAYRWRRAGTLPIEAYRSIPPGWRPACKCIGIEGSKCTIAPHINLSDWAYVLGFYLGDGWLCREKLRIGRIGFAVERSGKDKFSSELRAMKGVAWGLTENGCANSGSVVIRANNIFVYELLRHVCGIKQCYEKRIPSQWITSWPKAARRQLLDGLIDSDGYEQKPNARNKKQMVFTTTSSALANDLMCLLRSLGIAGGKHLRRGSKLGGIINGRQIIGRRDAYGVIWSGHDQDGNRKGHRGSRKRFIHDKQCFSELPVRKSSPSKPEQYVYDLEMDGHPSFVASGFLVHNTATPYRLVTDGFGGSILKFLTRTRPRVFKELIYYVQNGDLFRDGYLAKLKYTDASAGFDRGQLKLNSTGADYDDDSVARYYAKSGFMDRVAAATRRAMTERKNVLIFTRFVEDGERLMTMVHGVEMVTAKSTKREREAVVGHFRLGITKAVVNCGVLVHGFDYPELETVIIAAPTMSLARYYQEIGRCIRPHPEKDHAEVIDLCGNYSMFGRVEDLELVDGGRGMWAIHSNGRQLTNVYYGERRPVAGGHGGGATSVVSGTIEHETEKAYLLRHADGRELWWPKSKLEVMVHNGRTITAKIPKWLAIDKGMMERPPQLLFSEARP